MKSNIYLTGFSGTGKTTTGQELCRMLDWKFVDLDSEIELSCGKKIPNIFEEDGEEHFRILETECLRSVAYGNSQIISTGGGLPVLQENRRIMFATGTVVCLQADPGTILERLKQQVRIEGDDLHRPMLRSEKPLWKIKELLKFRAAPYAECDLNINTHNKSQQMVALEIVKGLDL